jgi:hypothetical protein
MPSINHNVLLASQARIISGTATLWVPQMRRLSPATRIPLARWCPREDRGQLASRHDNGDCGRTGGYGISMPLETPPHIATAHVESAHYANACGSYTHLHRESVSTLLAYGQACGRLHLHTKVQQFYMSKNFFSLLSEGRVWHLNMFYKTRTIHSKIFTENCIY